MTASPPPSPDAFTRRAAHHGRAGESLALGLTTLLLRIVTLGVYHFWGRTRVRRYLWSQTEWDGERLVYTGTGRELMLGYARAMLLVVLPVYVLSLAVGGLAVGWALWPLISLALGAGSFLYLSGVALYATLRYRLSRTVWRGIRFGLTGSPWRFGAVFTGQMLLTLVTLGLYAPRMYCRTAGHVLSHARFGTEPFRYDGSGRELMPAYLRTLGLIAALAVAGLLGLAALTPYLMWFGNQPPRVLLERVPLALLLPPLGAVLLAGAAAAAWIAFQGDRLRYHVAHTRLGALRFRLEFRWSEYVRLVLGNFSLLALTFGIGVPWAAVRTARFIASRLETAGTLDTAAIAQAQQALGRSGEGLSQVLDLGEL